MKEEDQGGERLGALHGAELGNSDNDSVIFDRHFGVQEDTKEKKFIVIDFRILVISRVNSLILYGATYYTSFVNVVSIIATGLPSRHFTSKNK